MLAGDIQKQGGEFLDGGPAHFLPFFFFFVLSFHLLCRECLCDSILCNTIPTKLRFIAHQDTGSSHWASTSDGKVVKVRHTVRVAVCGWLWNTWAWLIYLCKMSGVFAAQTLLLNRKH